MGITITNSGQGSVVRFRNLGRGGVMTTSIVPGLLNQYPGAAAAYSLRNLSSTYTGPLVRVRRSSDNAEQNIGFVNNVLDTASLLTFCGAGNGFVTTWYDQSGNARNAAQATTANQPQIVSTGNLILTNSKPSMTFDGTDFLVNIQTLTYSDFSLFMTTKYNASGVVFIQYSKLDLSVNGGIYQSSDTGIALIASYPSGDLGSVQRLQTHISTLSGATTTSKLYLNGTEKATGTRNLTSTKSTIAIGATDTGTSGANQNMHEFVLYPSNQTASRTGIESNTNSFYSIYTLNDSDAEAFFDRVTTAGGTLSATEQTAVNTLVVSMKAAGIWTAMKAIYPMVGSSAAACAQNLKSPSFTGTFTAGWTFANTGATPNGTSAFMNTGLNVSTNISLNNVHFSVYLRTNSDGTKVDLGVFNGSFSGLNIFTRFGNAQYTRLNEEDTATVSTTDSRGFRLGIRNSSTQKNVFINNTKTTLNTNSNLLVNLPIYIGAMNDQTLGARFYSDRQNAFASIGDGLTDTNASDFYTIVQAFQTTLSRQI